MRATKQDGGRGLSRWSLTLEWSLVFPSRPDAWTRQQVARLPQVFNGAKLPQSQEARSGVAVTILISNAQPVLYCAVEAEPRTLVAESKTAERVLAMSMAEDATKGTWRAPQARRRSVG